MKKKAVKKKPVTKKAPLKKASAKRKMTPARKKVQRVKKKNTHLRKSKKHTKKHVQKKTRPLTKKRTLVTVPSKSKKTKKLSARISTGISTLDRLTQGGFERNSTNIVVGMSGSGKSIFAIQFLIEGLKKGEKCLYVTFEEKKEQVYEHMKQFGWDLSDYEKKGKFIFLEYSPGKVKTMLEEGGGAIESILLTQKVTRMVIDSITSFELLFDNELEKREAALALFNMISNWDCTSLLTLEGRPSQKGEVASRTIEFESDGIIVLYFMRGRASRERYLEILKMRGTNHSKGIHKFSIQHHGVEVQLKPSNVSLP